MNQKCNFGFRFNKMSLRYWSNFGVLQDSEVDCVAYILEKYAACVSKVCIKNESLWKHKIH